MNRWLGEDVRAQLYLTVDRVTGNNLGLVYVESNSNGFHHGLFGIHSPIHISRCVANVSITKTSQCRGPYYEHLQLITILCILSVLPNIFNKRIFGKIIEPRLKDPLSRVRGCIDDVNNSKPGAKRQYNRE